MSLDDTDERAPLVSLHLTRRSLLAGAVIGLPAAVAGTLAVAHDDHDEDTSGDDSGDDHDDDHDDHDSGGDDRSHDDDDAPAAGGQGPAGSAEVHIVDDDEDAFSPGTVEIVVGGTVTFVNDDDKPHTATGADWDTGTLDPGSSQTITFDEPGEFAYACQFHPVMTGTVIVQAGGTPEASPMASPTADATVTIANFAFEPAEIEVPAGTTVTWANTDQVPHTATGADGSFDTDTIAAGESGTHTFDAPGTFAYACAFHPNMQGTVTVV